MSESKNVGSAGIGDSPKAEMPQENALAGDAPLRSALADLVSGVAHEIRNPINTISLTSQVVQKLFEKKGLDFDEFREYFGIIHFELGKIKKIIDNFVKFARVPNLSLRSVDLLGLLQRFGDRIAMTLKGQGIELSLDFEDANGVEIQADEELLSEAFSNILDNSVQTLTDGGEIRIRALKADSCVSVIFTDNGPGLPTADVDRIFNPYFTTSPGGLGLGLTLSRSIVETHGGRIRARAGRDGGAEFVVEFPLTRTNEESNG